MAVVVPADMMKVWVSSHTGATTWKGLVMIHSPRRPIHSSRVDELRVAARLEELGEEVSVGGPRHHELDHPPGPLGDGDKDLPGGRWWRGGWVSE